MDALHKAINILGSQSALANAIGVKPQVVSAWVKRGNIPAEHAPRIEEATKGFVTAEDLRPDVRWYVIRGSGSVAA